MATFETPGIEKFRFYDGLNLKKIKKICMEKVVGSMILPSSNIIRLNPLQFPIKNSNCRINLVFKLLFKLWPIMLIYLLISRILLLYYCKWCNLIGFTTKFSPILIGLN